MPNPYHFKANIDRLWRHSGSDAPAYRRLISLNKVMRQLFAHTERARLNYQRYLATDPYDVARHLLRDLYDHGDPLAPASEGALCLPLPLGEGWGEGPSVLTEEETTEEDDDPL